MPWVSETRSPNPTRSTAAKPAVMRRRAHDRRSSEPAARLLASTMAGPPSERSAATAVSRNPRS